MSGRNLGGRAPSVKFEFRSHAVKQNPWDTLQGGKAFVAGCLNPALRWRGCVDGWCSLAELELLGTASTGGFFPSRQPAFIPYVSSYVFPSFTWMAFPGLGADAGVSCLFRQCLLLLQLIPVSSGTLLGVGLTAGRFSAYNPHTVLTKTDLVLRFRRCLKRVLSFFLKAR